MHFFTNSIYFDGFADQLYDFSGINDYTHTFRNYYETSHFKPSVATEILNKVYLKDSIR